MKTMSRNRTFTATTVLAFSGLVASSLIAHADLKNTTQTTFSMGASESKSMMMRAVKTGFERYESASQIGAMKQQSVTIR